MLGLYVQPPLLFVHATDCKWACSHFTCVKPRLELQIGYAIDWQPHLYAQMTDCGYVKQVPTHFSQCNQFLREKWVCKNEIFAPSAPVNPNHPTNESLK